MTVARPIKHIAEADNPSTGELVIAPNLTATGKAGTVSRNCSTTVTNTGVAKCTTDVAADVAARPIIERCYNYWGRWGLASRKIGRVAGSHCKKNDRSSE